ncbi:MAG TPA: aminoacyl-tRNA hydrolase [Chloroflexota bacterium]|nr:aminoacyl-tRNA hydrolase [Chloroflexota bacterium]
MIQRLWGRDRGTVVPADQAGAAWLVVGLGNPGRQYERNRHNVGFRVLDELARRQGVRFDHQRAKGKLAIGKLDGLATYLLKPHTFVNDSGLCVGPVAHYYRVPLERLLVVCDDIDLPFGRLRLRPSGSSGGHNGLKSIMQALGGRQDFARLRLGVGRPPHVPEVVIGHVLDNFSKAEEEELAALIPAAADAVQLVLRGSLDQAMDRYNGRTAAAPASPTASRQA